MARRDYSEKEIAMFEALGFTDLLHEMDSLSYINPFTLYQFAVNRAFIDQITGNAVDSLRRCFVAFDNNKHFRLTKEWDDLIQL